MVDGEKSTFETLSNALRARSGFLFAYTIKGLPRFSLTACQFNKTIILFNSTRDFIRGVILIIPPCKSRASELKASA